MGVRGAEGKGSIVFCSVRFVLLLYISVLFFFSFSNGFGELKNWGPKRNANWQNTKEKKRKASYIQVVNN